MLGLFFKRKEVIERNTSTESEDWDGCALRNHLALELRGSLFSEKAKN